MNRQAGAHYVEWVQDRKREREAYARGDAFRRYTWDDVFVDPRAMLRELRELLLDRIEPVGVRLQ